jgi:hypothetical protein
MLAAAAVWDWPVSILVSFALMIIYCAAEAGWQLFKDARWVARWIRRRTRRDSI